MDLYHQSSSLEPVVEDNQSTSSPNAVLMANGQCLNQVPHSSPSASVGTCSNRKVSGGVRIKQGSNSAPVLMAESLVGVSTPPTSKGYGLRKWRRIKRDVIKDAGASTDSSKALKHGLSSVRNFNRMTNPVAPYPRQNSEDSVGSFHVFRNARLVNDGLGSNGGPSLDARFLPSTTAAAAPVNSENSDDQSSKGSAAASAPSGRYELPATMGYPPEKDRMKNADMSCVGGLAQRVPLGNGGVESSKKARGGEWIKIEMENSHSSMESDSRNSNTIFMQGAKSATSIGEQSRILMDLHEENGEWQFSEERHISFYRVDVGGNADHFPDDGAADASRESGEEKSDNGEQKEDLDHLAESMQTLQSVQQALESEVQKLGELRKVGTGVDTDIHGPPGSSFEVGGSSSLEFQISILTQMVEDLEIRLDEATTMLKAKESSIVALEVALNADKPLKEESSKLIGLKHGESIELESEIEDLYRQKIEAEVECVTLAKTVQNLRVAAGDPISLLHEQEALASEQALVLNKLEETEKKAALLKEKADEFQKYSVDILAKEEVLEMESRVHRVASCFCVQLILLVLIFWFLFLQLFPQAVVDIPT